MYYFKINILIHNEYQHVKINFSFHELTFYVSSIYCIINIFTMDANFLITSTSYKVNTISTLWLLFHLTILRRQLAIPYDENGGYSRCTMYDVNFTYIHSLGIRKADTNWPKKSCAHGWEYNYTEIPYSTIATEVIEIRFSWAFPFILIIRMYQQFDWVCENAYLPTLSQSIFFMGAIVGGLLFG